MNQLTTHGFFDLLYYQSKKVDVGSDSAHLHTEEKANPVNKYANNTSRINRNNKFKKRNSSFSSLISTQFHVGMTNVCHPYLYSRSLLWEKKAEAKRILEGVACFDHIVKSLPDLIITVFLQILIGILR